MNLESVADQEILLMVPPELCGASLRSGKKYAVPGGGGKFGGSKWRDP